MRLWADGCQNWWIKNNIQIYHCRNKPNYFFHEIKPLTWIKFKIFQAIFYFVFIVFRQIWLFVFILGFLMCPHNSFSLLVLSHLKMSQLIIVLVLGIMIGIFLYPLILSFLGFFNFLILFNIIEIIWYIFCIYTIKLIAY